MKRRMALVAAAVAVIAVAAWFASDEATRAAVTSAIGLSSPTTASKPTKPICSQQTVPVGDCIPQHMAGLPPDPGEAGKQTIDGIDADKDGIRDDIQRYIWEEYPDSERVRAALFLHAKTTQMRVHYGDSLGKEETRKRMPEIMRAAICSNRIADRTGEFDVSIVTATEKVRNKVTNTPERWKRSREFDYLLAHNVYDLPNLTVAEACGFDPEKLSN